MLSVVVPATDSPPTLARCVAAIRDSLPAGGELVVQNEPRGAGPAAARNLGARRARGDVLVFVDADVVVRAETLAAIERRLAADESLGAVFGSYDDSPAAGGVVSRFRNLLHHHVHATSAGPAETFWAGLGAVRREPFERVGGFDAGRYPHPAIEDIELGGRLRAAGVRIELDPTIQGTHLKAWTLRSMIATDFARRGVPWTRLQLERGPSSGLNMTPRRRFAALATAAALAAAAGRRPLPAAALGAMMVAANVEFFALLGSRGGWRLAAAGVPLQALHHLAAVASVPAGVASYVAAGGVGRYTR